MVKKSLGITIAASLIIAAGAFFGGRYSTRAWPSAPAQAPKAAEAEQPETELDRLVGLFADEPLEGGQRSPRLSKWLNDRVFMFIQLDKRDPKEATSVRLVGIGVKGSFCKEKQPTGADFRHFHRLVAPEYAQGHGGAPNDEGYWLFSIAAEDFAAGDRAIKIGDTTAFPATEPPDCADGD